MPGVKKKGTVVGNGSNIHGDVNDKVEENNRKTKSEN